MTRDKEGNVLVPLDEMGNIEHYIQRGNEFIRDGKTIRAQAIFENILKLDENNVEGYSGLGTAYYHQAMYTEALESLDKAIELDETHARSYTMRAVTYQQLGDWTAALVNFDQAVELTEEKDYVSLLNRGIVRGYEKMVDEALSDMNKALDLVSDKATQSVIYYERAQLKAGEERYDQAIVDYSKSITADPEKLYTYEGRAQAYLATDQHDQAIADYTHIYNAEPNAMPLLYRAQIYWRNDDNVSAKSDYNEAVKKFPTDPQAWSARGYYRAATGDHENALEDCEKAIEIAPEHSTGYISRGYTYFLMKDYEQALIDFDQAVGEETVEALPIIGKAVALHALGRKDEAIDLWKTIQEQDKRFRSVPLFEDYLPIVDTFTKEAQQIIAAIN